MSVFRRAILSRRTLVLAIGLAEGDGVMAAVGAAIGLGGSAAVPYALLVIAPAVFGTP